MTDYANARKAYNQSAILTAPPERLVVMLYDGAIRFLNQAAVAMRSGNTRIAWQRIMRADAILNELDLTLDMSHGELPKQLRSIYLFCRRQLIEANRDSDPGRIDAVGRMLGELRESWEQVAAATAAQRVAG